MVGGVVGDAYSAVTVTNCFNTGSVTANGYDTAYTYAGGVVGWYNSIGTIQSNFNIGATTSTGTYGGVMGKSGSVTSCGYYDTSTSTYKSQNSSSAYTITSGDIYTFLTALVNATTTPLTSNLFSTSIWQTAWDFEEIWIINETSNYPTFIPPLKTVYHTFIINYDSTNSVLIYIMELQDDEYVLLNQYIVLSGQEVTIAMNPNTNAKMLICGSYMNNISIVNGAGNLEKTQYYFETGTEDANHSFLVSVAKISNNYVLI